MATALTVYLVAEGEPDWQLSDGCSRAGASLCRLPLSRLAQELPAASVRGAVVVVVDGDRDAKLALGLGADEVVRISGFDVVEFEHTLERARLRASARAMRDRRVAGTSETDSGLSLLGSALGEQLVDPIHAATEDCEQVAAALRVLLDLSDDLVGWAALSAPTEELRRLAARRLAAPSSAQVREALVRMQIALADARFTAGRLRDLVAGSADDGCLRADRLVLEFGRLIAPHVASFATVDVDTESPCAAPVPTSFFLSVAALLVSNALGALRAAGKADGRIVLRTLDAEGLAVLEVEDDAGEMSADLGAGAGPGLAGARQTAGGLAVLRERLMARGGDLLVQSDEAGTQVRVVFPAAARELDVAVDSVAAPARASGLPPRGLN